MKNIVLKILSNKKIINLIRRYYKPYDLRIVCFHSISSNHDFLPSWLCINTENFMEQVSFLKDSFNIISFSDLDKLKKRKIKNPLIITFDDGLKDSYEEVLPILKKMGVKATFFINSLPLIEKKLLWIHNLYLLNKNIDIHTIIKNLLDTKNGKLYKNDNINDIRSLFSFVRKNYTFEEINYSLNKINQLEGLDYDFNKIYMNEEELKELIKNGMEIGCHGYGHFYFSKMKDFKKEGELAKDFLESIFDKKITAFAYPFGDPESFNDFSDNYLKNIFRNICTTIPGVNELADKSVLKRVCSYEMTKEKIVLKLLLGY